MDLAEKLVVYEKLLLKWQMHINLIGSSTIKDLQTRHFEDSLQLLLFFANATCVVDVGSGAGLPGLLLAMAGIGPMHLVESDAKKVAFLLEANRVTEANAIIHHQRIEALQLDFVSHITARALAELSPMLALIKKIVSRETICIFPKGQNYSRELDTAYKMWDFKHEIIPSKTQTTSAILKLWNIRERYEQST